MTPHQRNPHTHTNTLKLTKCVTLACMSPCSVSNQPANWIWYLQQHCQPNGWQECKWNKKKKINNSLGRWFRCTAPIFFLSVICGVISCFFFSVRFFSFAFTYICLKQVLSRVCDRIDANETYYFDSENGICVCEVSRTRAKCLRMKCEQNPKRPHAEYWAIEQWTDCATHATICECVRAHSLPCVSPICMQAKLTPR